jgi:hypothetical protein
LTLSQAHDFCEFVTLAQLAFFLQKTLNRSQKYIFF